MTTASLASGISQRRWPPLPNPAIQRPGTRQSRGGHDAEIPEPPVVAPVADRDRYRERGVEPGARDDLAIAPATLREDERADTQQVARAQAQPRRRRGRPVLSFRPFECLDAERFEQGLAGEFRQRLAG